MDVQRTIDLTEFLPSVSKDSRDMQEIMRVESIEVQALWDVMVQIFYDQFITIAGEFGLSQWENILDIFPDGDASFDDRRLAILTALAGTRPYTYRKLEEILIGLCGKDGYQVDLNIEKYYVNVFISLGSKKQRSSVVKMLEEITPLNLKLTVSLLYNRHVDLKPFIHETMKQWTHHSLREDVLN